MRRIRLSSEKNLFQRFMSLELPVKILYIIFVILDIAGLVGIIVSHTENNLTGMYIGLLFIAIGNLGIISLTIIHLLFSRFNSHNVPTQKSEEQMMEDHYNDPFRYQ